MRIAKGWKRAAFSLAAAASLAAGALFAAPAGGLAGQPAATASTPDTAAAAYQRAKALFDQDDYTAAIAEADRALALNPRLMEAKILRQVSMSRLAAATQANATTGPGTSLPLLTPEQINSIRLTELRDDDTDLQGSIDRKTLERFWNEVARKDVTAQDARAAEGAFLNPANLTRQVQRIRASNLPQYIEKIKLTSDPADMLRFKTNVHRFVLENCATSGCHGGAGAGNFRLVRPAIAVTPAILYTNFYILTTYTRDNERMINRDDPRRSLLLQYALPKSLATLPHPGRDVRKLPSEKTPEFTVISDWIRGLAFPTPVYHLPGMAPTAAATAPATAPARR